MGIPCVPCFSEKGEDCTFIFLDCFGFSNAILESEKNRGKTLAFTEDIPILWQSIVTRVKKNENACLVSDSFFLVLKNNGDKRATAKGLSLLAQVIFDFLERLSKIAPPFDLPIFSGLIEIQKLSKTIEDVLEPIRKAQEEMAKAFKAALIDDEGRERVHKIAQAWASFGLCPPIGNESFDQWSPPKSEKEVQALYEHFVKEECPETYCQAYLSQKAGVAYEYAKEAVDDFKRGAYRSCAAMLFALLDGELLRKETRREKPKNSKDYRLLLGPRFYCDKVRDKKEQDFYITYIVPQCFFLTANYYYENAVDFQNPATQLIGLRPCLDHGMLLHVDGLTCFKIFTFVPYCDYSIRWAFRSESEDK